MKYFPGERAVIHKFDEVGRAVTYLQFDGSDQQNTPVANIRTTLLVVLRLRSRVTQRLSAKKVDVFGIAFRMLQCVRAYRTNCKECKTLVAVSRYVPANCTSGKAVAVLPWTPPS